MVQTAKTRLLRYYKRSFKFSGSHSRIGTAIIAHVTAHVTAHGVKHGGVMVSMSDRATSEYPATSFTCVGVL